jgi:hypothetical protein
VVYEIVLPTLMMINWIVDVTDIILFITIAMGITWNNHEWIWISMGKYHDMIHINHGMVSEYSHDPY